MYCLSSEARSHCTSLQHGYDVECKGVLPLEYCFMLIGRIRKVEMLSNEVMSYLLDKEYFSFWAYMLNNHEFI